MFCSHPGGRGPPGQNHGVNRNSKENGFITALGRFCTFWSEGRVVTWHGLRGRHAAFLGDKEARCQKTDTGQFLQLKRPPIKSGGTTIN